MESVLCNAPLLQNVSAFKISIFRKLGQVNVLLLELHCLLEHLLLELLRGHRHVARELRLQHVLLGLVLVREHVRLELVLVRQRADRVLLLGLDHAHVKVPLLDKV